MSQRRELVLLADREGSNFRELCRRFKVQPRIAYKWVERYRSEGDAGLADRSRRPVHSPERTPAEIEATVIALRTQHPAWGGRKLARRLRDQGVAGVPSPSTITAILHRKGLIDPEASKAQERSVRFERARPNELWQMDFKGHFPTAAGRCHPLTVVDDHSRFALSVAACGDEQGRTVQQCLTAVFRRYGLPDRMLMDNGPPWGDSGLNRWTKFGAWLLRLGVGVSHGRPCHPQTQGKDERFHRTLKAEVIGRRAWRDLDECDQAFEAWRQVYNAERPHQALQLATPASRYQLSYRVFPEQLPAIEYAPDAIVRKVQAHGEIYFKNRAYRIGKPFIGEPVALRPTMADGKYEVIYCLHRIAELDLYEVNP